MTILDTEKNWLTWQYSKYRFYRYLNCHGYQTIVSTHVSSDQFYRYLNCHGYQTELVRFEIVAQSFTGI